MYDTFNYEDSPYLHKISVNEDTMELECRKYEEPSSSENYTVLADEDCVNPEAYRKRVEEYEKKRKENPSPGVGIGGGIIDAPKSMSIQYGSPQNCPKKGSKRSLLSICKRLV